MNLFLEGILFGVPAIFFAGPVLITLLQASVQFGFRGGLAVAVGISLSDVVCIWLCYIGVVKFLQAPFAKLALGAFGGLVLVGFGLTSMLSKKQALQDAEEFKSGSSLLLITKGFLVNFVNPFVFSYWIGAIALAGKRHGFDGITMFIFFSGSIFTIFVTDSLKAWLGGKMRGFVQNKGTVVMRKVVGGFLILSGMFMFIVTLREVL